MVKTASIVCLVIVCLTTAAANTGNGRAKTVEKILKLLLKLSGSKHEERVAFSASLSHVITNNKVKNYKIVFDKIITNVGNGYNSNTGVFTVPYDGLYVFQWTIITRPGSYFNTELVVNGVPKRQNAADTGGGKSWISGSSMVTILLHKNDQVWIRKWNTAGNTVHGFLIPGFSGFRLA